MKMYYPVEARERDGMWEVVSAFKPNGKRDRVAIVPMGYTTKDAKFLLQLIADALNEKAARDGKKK